MEKALRKIRNLGYLGLLIGITILYLAGSVTDFPTWALVIALIVMLSLVISMADLAQRALVQQEQTKPHKGGNS